MNLVIVESQGKIATITKYLNENPALRSYGKFTVLASYGHIQDLAKKKLAINIERDFTPQYEILADKKDAIQKLLKAAKAADVVYLASDADMEGHAIAEEIRVVLSLGENYKRIIFTEITPSALQRAIENPGRIDQNQLESQQCRRVLDRLVGFKLSPLLWSKFASSVTLSAGRVQSAVLHLIIAREKEIEAFKTSSYWTFHGNFDFMNTKLEDIKLYDPTTLHKATKQSEVDAFFKNLKNIWSVEAGKPRTRRESPDAPFITSSLQQEASGKLRLGIKRIMAVAQELYEAGHITYMRTDSFHMSDTFKEIAKTFIDSVYPGYYGGGASRPKKSIKGAQEAHECIRVTHPERIEITGGRDQKELYALIWRRTIAYLMKPAIYDELDLSIQDISMKNTSFKTKFSKVQFNGYLIVYGIQNEKNDFDKYTNKKLSIKCDAITAKNTWMSPPTRYNDAGLVKLMETNGIGRPSTLATIIDKLFEKIYVIKTDIKGTEHATLDFEYVPGAKTVRTIKGKTYVGAENSKVKPTEIGLKVDAYLTENFDYIVDKDFTARMEENLDSIAQGSKTRLEVLKDFWNPFSRNLNQEIANKKKKMSVQAEKKELTVAGKKYIVRMGPYGAIIEYDNGKKNYIGLKGYLQMVKKEYLDVDETDVQFLLNLPMRVGSYENKDVMLHNGPYGFYLKHAGQTYKIPRFAIQGFLETKTFTTEQLSGFITYKALKTTSAPARSTKKPAARSAAV